MSLYHSNIITRVYNACCTLHTVQVRSGLCQLQNSTSPNQSHDHSKIYTNVRITVEDIGCKKKQRSPRPVNLMVSARFQNERDRTCGKSMNAEWR